MNMIILTPVCPICGKEHNLAIENEEGFYKWNVLFEEPQKALPELTVEEREVLISQMCKTCQREIFALSFCEEGIETDDYLGSVFVKCGDYARFARIANTIGTFKALLRAKNIRFERIEKDIYVIYDAEAKDVNRKGIRGDFLVVKKMDGKFVSLSEKEVTKYLRVFNRPVLEDVDWNIDGNGTLFVYCDGALIAEISDVSEEMAETIVSEVIEDSFYVNNNYSKEAIQEWLRETK